MRRDEFMKELEYLLQDISEEDKTDAIAYYQDYLEEAGPENEEEVIRNFGSPERIAAIIRADINGSLEDGGEFTENGYEDERFREPNFQLVERRDLPEAAEEPKAEKQETGSAFTSSKAQGKSTGRTNGHGWRRNGSAGAEKYKSGYGSAFRQEADTSKNRHREETASPSGRAKWEWWQILGMILMACCILPVVIPLVLGIGGGAIGLVFGLGGGMVGILALLGTLLLAVTIALAAVTFGLLLAGVLLIFVSFGQMAVNGIQGILCLGAGVGIFGLGLLCLSMCGLYYGMFLPWLGKTIINLVSRLIHRKEAAI